MFICDSEFNNRLGELFNWNNVSNHGENYVSLLKKVEVFLNAQEHLVKSRHS